MSQPHKDQSSKDPAVQNEELENYFANTIIPQLYVDGDMILRKFTPPVIEHFSITEEDIGREINDLEDSIQYPTLIANIKEVNSTGDIFEKEIQTNDGKWFQMNILPYRVFKENRINGVIITFVDITERINTLKELEKLNADHITLMHALSHDIRQPLSTVVLLADGLMEAYDQRNSKQFKKWIRNLKVTSSTMRSMVDEFAEEKEELPEIKQRREKVNIEEVSENVIIAFRTEIFNEKINVTTNFRTSGIMFPRNSLRSILYNLLSNSIKYKKPDKRLKILLSTTKIKDYVLLRVMDNGRGIDKKDQEKIFKKSARLGKDVEGTGMGLYIIKSMIENNRGKIEVESTLGKGSTFCVYFKDEEQ